jgi:hypothetical protein
MEVAQGPNWACSAKGKNIDGLKVRNGFNWLMGEVLRAGLSEAGIS